MRLPVLAILLSTAVLAEARGKLLSVRAAGDAATAAVEVRGDRPLSFTTLKLTSPPRVVVDCAETSVGEVPRQIEVDDGTVRRIGVASAGARTARVVIELVADAEFDVRASGSRIEVRITRAAPLLASAGAERDAGAIPERPDVVAAVEVAQPTVVGAPPPRSAPPPPPLAAQVPPPGAVVVAPHATEPATSPEPPPRVASRAEQQGPPADAPTATPEEPPQPAEKPRQAEGAAPAAGEREAGASGTPERRVAEKRAEVAAAEKRDEEAGAAKREAAAAAEKRAEVAAAEKRDEEVALAKREAAAAAEKRAEVAAAEKRDEEAAGPDADARKRASLPTVALQGSRPAAPEESAPARAASAPAAPARRVQQPARTTNSIAAPARRRAPQRSVAVAQPQRRVAIVQPARKLITGIGFRPAQGGEVIVHSDKPLEYGVSGEEGAILIHLPQTAIPLPNNRRPLDTRFFDGPVQRIVPLAVAGGTDVRIELRERSEYEIKQDGPLLTVTFSTRR